MTKPSCQKVKCKECLLPIVRKNLKRHFNTRHPGKQHAEFVDLPSVSQFFFSEASLPMNEMNESATPFLLENPLPSEIVDSENLNKISQSQTRGSTGVFGYKFDLGTDFRGKKCIPREFQHLKLSIFRHSNSLLHKKLLSTGEVEIKCLEKLKILRTGYSILKNSLPYEKFESLIVLQHLNGTKIGNINHSSKLVPKLRDSLYVHLMNRVKSYCTELPCLAILADQVLLKRRTIEILSIQFLDTSTEDLFKTVVVGASVAEFHDGNQLSDNWYNHFSNLGITSRDKIAAIGADGAYHHCRVPEKFLSKTGEPIDGVPFIWDLGVSYRLPVGFSDTRWARYSCETLTTFLMNFDLYKEIIEQNMMAERECDFSENVQKILYQSQYSKAQACVLVDILCRAKECSLVVQNTQSFPWEKVAAFEKLSLEIKEMKDGLPKLLVTSQGGKLNANDIERELMDISLWTSLSNCKELSQTFISSLDGILSVFQESLSKKLKGQDGKGRDRGTSNHNVIINMKHIRTLGDLSLLKNKQGDKTDVLEMVRAFLHLRRAKIIPETSSINKQSFEAAFRSVRDIPKDMTNQDIFKVLWRSSEHDVFLKTYMHLVSRLWLCMPSESVVESMASVLKHKFGEHRNLLHENAGKELIISWNGPPVHLVDPILEKLPEFNTMKSTTANFLKLGTVITSHIAQDYPLRCILQKGR